eukprot:12897397-Prorocentrum_lima.AAC.1
MPVEAEAQRRALAFEDEVQARMDLEMQACRLSAEAPVASLKQEMSGTRQTNIFGGDAKLRA